MSHNTSRTSTGDQGSDRPNGAPASTGQQEDKMGDESAGLSLYLGSGRRQGVIIGAETDATPSVAISSVPRAVNGLLEPTRLEVRTRHNQEIMVRVCAGGRRAIMCAVRYHNNAVTFRRRLPGASHWQRLATTLNWVPENQGPISSYELDFPRSDRSDLESLPVPAPGDGSGFSVLYSTARQPVEFLEPTHPWLGFGPAWRPRQVLPMLDWAVSEMGAVKIVLGLQKAHLVSSWAKEVFEVIFLTGSNRQGVRFHRGQATFVCMPYHESGAAVSRIYGIAGGWIEAGGAPFRLSFFD